MLADVRFGSKADIRIAIGHVRFTPFFHRSPLVLPSEISFLVNISGPKPWARSVNWGSYKKSPAPQGLHRMRVISFIQDTTEND
jgi:hypothetical protein